MKELKDLVAGDDVLITSRYYRLPYVHSLQHLFFGMGIKNEMEV